MALMKTPGVYIVEQNAFPNSVVEVATAVPAFVGYTERAELRGKSLRKQPTRITSLAEFERLFGLAPAARFVLVAQTDDTTVPTELKVGDTAYALQQPAGREGGDFLLHRAVRHFFQNQGGPCYIVSVGDHAAEAISADSLCEGIDQLSREQEPTLLVVPDAMRLSREDCTSVQQHALMHCGGVMRNRVAILDVWGGQGQDDADAVCSFRDSLGTNHLDFGAAYYPWLHTTVVQDAELSYRNVASIDLLQQLLRDESGLPETLPDSATPRQRAQAQAIADLARSHEDWTAEDPADTPARKAQGADARMALLHKTLLAQSPALRSLMAAIRHRLNILPPSAAMAGVYTMVDNSRGVWKAPANVSLNGVIAPTVNLSAQDQENLNVDFQGKSINAIRSFVGEGVLVWGARTLDGNSQDWRYINVRRTMIMLEESCRLAAKALVFEPNVASTWVTVKSMVSNFLTGIWKQGGLVGATPDEAFAVHVGLGETMTAEDVLDGVMRITVLVAISRPAEFIEITFQQQMQQAGGGAATAPAA